MLTSTPIAASGPVGAGRRLMRQFAPGVKVYLACKPVDMRRGFGPLRSWPFRLFHFRVNLNRGSRSAHQPNAVRHHIDVDPHRHPLREPHPGENGIYRSESSLIGLRVRNIYAARDAVDVTANDLLYPMSSMIA